MGQLVTSSIPNLINGVSQQPYSMRLPTQAEEMINCYPSVVEFLKKRQGARHITKIGNASSTQLAIHYIDRDASEKYIACLTNNDVFIFDLNGVPRTVSFPHGRDYLNCSNPATSLVCLTINDYTFVLNKEMVVQMGSAMTPGRTHKEALVFVKQANYGTTYTVIVNGIVAQHTTATATDQAVRTDVIAQDLGTKLLAALPAGQFDIHESHSTLWIRRTDGAEFGVSASDSRANTHIIAIRDKVQRFSDLPTVAPDGYMVEVTGEAANNFDNYYVQFAPNNIGTWFDRGLWQECPKPGLPKTFDAATMPHALVRQADGTFHFLRLTWDERVAGDEESSPAPSFVGRRLNNILFYKNRLAFLSQENLIMSTVGKFFMFWPSTATTLVDSDPIDVAASHTKMVNLEHACVFSGGLLLFSSGTQFSVEHEDVLSNSTVSLKPITEFETSTKAAPVSAGRTVFFTTARGVCAGVREYFAMPDTDTNDAADISAHIPTYIPSTIYKLTGSPNEDVLFALSDGAPDTIFVYKYFWNNNEKLQSAWSKWVLKGRTLASACMVDTDLYVVTRDASDNLYLEAFNIEPGHQDDDMGFEVKLDRKITEVETPGRTYDAVNRETLITLPYNLTAQDGPPTIVIRPGPNNLTQEALPKGLVLDSEISLVPDQPNKIKVSGYDLSGSVKFYFGTTYESKYIFSRQVLRENKQGGNSVILAGRLQLRNMTINFHETGYFEANVTPAFRPPNRYPFTGRVLGTASATLGQIGLHTGAMTIPLLAKNDQVTLEITSSSPLPFNLISAEWEAFYHSRSNRM